MKVKQDRVMTARNARRKGLELPTRGNTAHVITRAGVEDYLRRKLPKYLLEFKYHEDMDVEEGAEVGDFTMTVTRIGSLKFRLLCLGENLKFQSRAYMNGLIQTIKEAFKDTLKRHDKAA